MKEGFDILSVNKEASGQRLKQLGAEEDKYITYTVSQKTGPRHRNRCWVRWELEVPFDGQLCQEYLCQKSSKSVNPS